MGAKTLPSPEVLRQLLRYEPDTGKLFWLPRPREMFATDGHFKTWNTRFSGQQAFTSKNSKGYAQTMVMSQNLRAHRVVIAIHFGAWPEGDVDHINGDRADNRLANLRHASRTQNRFNQGPRRDCQSGIKGVRLDKGRQNWRARITAYGVCHDLGRFRCKTAAALAYAKASMDLHGVFGRTKPWN